MIETRTTILAATRAAVARGSAILALCTVGALVATFTSGPAQASDGGSETCVENGGTVAGCHLIHVKLYGSERCLRIQDYNSERGGSQLKGLQITCRKNSVNAYVDPSIKTILIELDTSDPRGYENNTNRCFRAKSYLIHFGGEWVFRDKLIEVSTGDRCTVD